MIIEFRFPGRRRELHECSDCGHLLPESELRPYRTGSGAGAHWVEWCAACTRAHGFTDDRHDAPGLAPVGLSLLLVAGLCVALYYAWP